ncbi:protocadherin-12 isoform X2 [Myripristis murdjan]|uniref:protocadherin-12 isoform X2 n=1 Tax=Myripristis murdjan TaxID=586833 RepID=UPI0011763C34|nr:protocadherin-12 isoform X2 [Myripristis murdjan]
MLLALLLVLSFGSEARSSDPKPITIQYRVWEEQPAGTQVGRLVDDLRQRDEGGSLEDFQVVEHGQALPFSVSARDGAVSTLGQLDREELCRGADLCELAFSVLYRKGGAMNFLRVRVEVMDLNDHSPSFPSAVQEVEISETASLRMRIPLDRAVDPDAGPNSLQTYSLSVNQHFALDVKVAPGGTKQAELVVIKELDREVQASFDLTLLAWDKGNPPRSGSTLVRVNILDSNDNSPTFEDSTPTVELTEDTARGTIVINLKATDPDQGLNGEVEYSLSKHAPPEVQKIFTVDTQTGAVTLKGPLDYEAKHSYEVDIQARDRGPNSIPSHCKLHVKLKDVNDNAPRIHITWTPPESPVATVLEGAPEDTFLALVMVSDADSGDNGRVKAHIQQGSGPFRLKRIHGDNYMIVTNGSLDRERIMQYNITLLAQDYGDPPLSCVRHLTVHVLDENDNAPVFSKPHYKASFDENNVAGYQALKVEAHDIDLELSGRVSYTIQESNDLETATASFAIHPTSGVVSVRRPLDYEESRSYSFVVEAIDQGFPPLTSTATVQIDVQDVNDNYPVIKEPKPRKGVASLSVPVNADKGEIVTELGNEMDEGSTSSPMDHLVREGIVGFLASTIKAEDPDSGLNGQVTYLITDGNPYGLFWLDHTTGQLFVNTTNATELIGKTFKVDIAVSDMGTPSLVTKATLEVTFINLKDHLKNSSPGNRGQLSFTMMMAICLGATCLLLLLTIALVTTFCRPEKRDNRAYNCRQAESTYTRHPRRPQKNIRKSDIQLIPVIRGRKEEPPEDECEAQPLAPPPMMSEDQHTERQYSVAPSVMNTSFHSQGYPEGDATLPMSHCRTLRKPGSIEIDGTLPRTPATPYRTLRKTRNPSSSSSLSHSSTLKRHGNRPEAEEVDPPCSASQATLRRPKTSEGRCRQEAEHRQMLRNLVRLSMAAFGENAIELSSASPEVQISQLLSLLRQGQLQPRPNFRGNKYSHRTGRYAGQDCTDWQSTKDSGHGESEAGDVDWEPGRDSPIDPQLEEGLHNLLNNADDVFSEVDDPAWMARLSLPLAGDYHDNVFVPNGPPSPEAELRPQDALDSASFSTFGKTPEKDGALGGALLSEVSTLFEMLMTQKADAQPGPHPEVLYRLSAAYRRSLGLDAANAAPAANAAARNSGNAEKRSGLAPPSGLYH